MFARKQIKTVVDLDAFNKSATKSKILEFIKKIGSSLKGTELHFLKCENSNLSKICQALKELQESTVNFKPHLGEKNRFGNAAFREFFDSLRTQFCQPLVEEWDLEENEKSYVVDLLEASFGDRQRIDYGTGHELSFICALYVLYEKKIFSEEDLKYLGLCVFFQYLQVCRHLQDIYALEPAGSHGAWGLDDYHHLPFYFGSAQLTTSEVLTSIVRTNPEEIENLSKTNMYFDAIKQIIKTKTGAPLFETSPIVYNMSSVPSWDKIESGLLKMYAVEVLGKFPVVQHFLFGPFLDFA